MMSGLFIAALAVAVLFPDTSIGKAFRRTLIEAPARKLPYLTTIRLTSLLVAIVAVAAFILYVKDQGLVFMAQAAPEAITGFITFDVGAYLDIVGLVWILAAAVRFKALSRAAAPIAVRMKGALSTFSIRCARLCRREIRPRLKSLLRKLEKRSDEDEPAFAFLVVA